MPTGPAYSFESLDVQAIELDVADPRVAQYIELYGNHITAEQMSLALSSGDSCGGDNGTTFHSLRESIKTCGQIIHPIIVSRADGGLVAIEGNTHVLNRRERLRRDH